MYYPMTDPLFDAIASIGFGIGMVAAIYLVFWRDTQPKIWIPFILYAIAFGSLGAEGGALSQGLPNGTFRLIAMISLLLIELFGLTATLESDHVAQK